MIRFQLVFIAICFLTSCGQKETNSLVNHTLPLNSLEKLYSRYNRWKRVPYKLGGMTKEGIDCSGMVVMTFDEEFNVQLPRSTAKLAKLDNEIALGALKAGDLVFFKINEKNNQNHVGIYLENQMFLHASTSKGVIISDLNNSYWTKNYWKSIRVLEP